MRRSPVLQGQFFAAALRSLAGSTHWHVVIYALGALILFSWFTDQLWDLLTTRTWPLGYQWLPLLGFPLLVGWMLIRARSIANQIVPDVQCEQVDRDNVQKAGCLILFLSPPGKDRTLIESWLADADAKGGLEERRAQMAASWRMPLEAIFLHAGRLKQVAVICSADAAEKGDGTWRDFATFRRLVHHLLGKDGVEVLDAAIELQGKQGVDFEDADALVDLINRVYQYFYSHGFKDPDILIDITGGQKVPAIAGAAVALAEGRRFQYVSTRDYKVRLYNVTYTVV